MSDVITGFARTEDGEQLYYRQLGSQGPVIACCNGVGVSTFFWKYVSLRFRDRYRVILWDYRGHGLSTVPRDPGAADLSIERNARDLFCVLDALHVAEPVILMGHSMGCQVILEAWHQQPDRVRALVPMFGTAGRPLDTLLHVSFSKTLVRGLARVTERLGRSAYRLLLPLYASPVTLSFSRLTGLVDRYYAARVDMDHYLDHLQHMDPLVFLRMLDQMGDHDLWGALGGIHVPTLVFGGENDLFTPLHCSERMAADIPGAELTVLAEGSHAAIVEHPETINLRLERFLADRVRAASPS
ncbi:MAG: alpha/beta hydrolase [Alphaproteobacteria bacterium]|nr:alpha/beta hydrolase [Alphaproteobacteria bacterium]